MTILGFVILTVFVVALAGPMPKVITGILILVISGMILSPKWANGTINLINGIFTGGNAPSGIINTGVPNNTGGSNG